MEHNQAIWSDKKGGYLNYIDGMAVKTTKFGAWVIVFFQTFGDILSNQTNIYRIEEVK
jgi:hypothetical protein